jgi:hypothetical protein
VARIVLIERRDRAAQVHAIHLGALVMHHARIEFGPTSDVDE